MSVNGQIGDPARSREKPQESGFNRSDLDILEFDPQNLDPINDGFILNQYRHDNLQKEKWETSCASRVGVMLHSHEVNEMNTTRKVQVRRHAVFMGGFGRPSC